MEKAHNLVMIWFARPALSSRSAPITCCGVHSRWPLEEASATELLRILADDSVNLNWESSVSSTIWATLPTILPIFLVARSLW